MSKMTGRTLSGILALLISVVAIPRPAAGVPLRDALRNAPSVVGLTLDPRYRNAVDALVDSAARALPYPAASGGFTYRFDSATGTYERTSETFGPQLFMERPQTIGRHVWNLGVTFQYLELDEFDGDGLGRDPYPLLNVPGTSGPTRFFATPKFVYHLSTVNVTYGVLDDLDLNVAIPLIAGDFDTNISRIGPSGNLNFASQHSQVSVGVGDLMLRAKYRVCEWEGLTTALGARLRVPSGNSDEAIGIGDTELGPYVSISALYWGRVSPSWNAGFDFNLDDSHLSSGHYAFGVDVQAVKEWLDIGFAFLGRSEIDGRESLGSIGALHQTPTGPALTPYEGHYFNRNDMFDFQAGATVRVYKTLTFSLSFVKAINDAGLRSSTWSPIGALAASF